MSAPFKPSVIAPFFWRHPLESILLRHDLIKAVDKLHGVGAWPSAIGNFVITILHPTKMRGYQSAMRTGWEMRDDNENGAIERAPDGTSIDTSLRIFIDEAGAKFVELGASRADIALFFLAHEIHHLDEAERMAACGIKAGQHHSALVGAARPELAPEWREALRAFSVEFPHEDGLPPALSKAGITANEASADLAALHWMGRIKPANELESFAKLLVQFRRSYEVASQDGSPANYVVAATIESCLAEGLVSLDEIHRRCWRLAIDEAIAFEELPPKLRAIFERLPHEPWTHPISSSAPAKSSGRSGLN